MRRVAPAVLIALVVLFGTACSGSAEPPPVSALGPVAMTGDPRTADACALLDPQLFTGTIPPSPYPGVGDAVGSCRLIGQAEPYRPQSAEASFAHERSMTITSAEPPEPAGSATILRPLPTYDVCRRVVRLVDGTLVMFAGRTISEQARIGADGGPPPVADCQVAERALRFGLARLAGTGITHGPSHQPESVLERGDACAALGDPSARLGLTDPPRYVGFADRHCFVGTPAPGQPVAWLDFVAMDTLPPYPTPRDLRPEIRPGREGQVSSYPGQFGSACQVLVPWNITNYYVRPGPKQWEVVRVVVELPVDVLRACDLAVQLARESVPRLPAPPA
ncbi:hypothetical protein [Actinomycetospora termitidis]|uniref:DUF3558 domain-containing protein n=1 Tax=Actinomycetospora termitidis TaxID=3053470 RepID=A0ABT7MA12_9PSEU|nr:hypothetical protein [Actinomycetospora sp. Odt1-22]MDL5157491.1 hypothetical protein [Actinomycetospora sp. Odt1-22]